MVPEINEVISDKPASKCGLQKGDLITEFNGVKISNPQQLTDMIRENTGKESVLKWSRAFRK